MALYRLPGCGNKKANKTKVIVYYFIILLSEWCFISECSSTLTRTLLVFSYQQLTAKFTDEVRYLQIGLPDVNDVIGLSQFC